MTTRDEIATLTEQRRAEFTDDTPDQVNWQAAVARARSKADTERVRQQQQADAERAAAVAAREQERWLADWPRHVPRRFHDATVDELTGDLETVAREWQDNRNVLLLGGVGVGKTHAAIAMARDAYETRGWTVLFAPSVELLDDLRPGGPERAMEQACDVDVLVLDDLGSERPTDWTAERLYRIVNRRWLEERPTIATANLSAADLEAAVGARMFSRLWHGALAVEVAGEDRRRAA